MAQLPEDKLDQLVERWNAVQSQLASGPDQEVFVQLSKEFAEIDPVVTAIQELRNTRQEKDDLEVMLADPETDAEMSELARSEVQELGPRIEAMEHALQIQLLPKDAADEKSVILEIRAGTGGDEAALFAGDLFRMYQRYADLQKWKTEIVSSSDSEAGGYRENCC